MTRGVLILLFLWAFSGPVLSAAQPLAAQPVPVQTVSAPSSPESQPDPNGQPGASTTIAADPDINEAGELSTLLSDEVIAVGATFAGAKIALFGALPDRKRGDVVIALKGPELPVRVLKRRRILGLWIAGEPRSLFGAPAFYRVLSSKPLAETAPAGLLRRLEALPDSVATTLSDEEGADEVNAFVRIKTAEKLYGIDEAVIETRAGGLFKVDLRIPVNAPVGLYEAEVHLFRDGRFISSTTTSFHVAKTGFEREIAQWAQDRSLLYGLLCVGLALSWGAAAAALLRRS